MEENIIDPIVEDLKQTTVSADQTLEQILEGSVQSDEDKGSENKVPLSTFLELKKENKEFRHELQSLKDSLKSKSDTRVEEGVSDLATKYDIDENFLRDILKAAKEETTKEIDSRYKTAFEKQEKEAQVSKFNKAFDELFEKSISENDEYKNLPIDKEVIKSLATSPSYSKMTIPQILEKLYGNVVMNTGKKSSEDTATNSRQQDAVNFANMDEKTSKMVLSDPNLKKQYNDFVQKELEKIL